MREYAIAVLGATGAVGREMLRELEERNVPVKRLLPLASARSAGTSVPFRGGSLPVEICTEDSFKDVDFVLGAVESDTSRALAPAIVRAGAVYIDNSSAFRMDPDVPLVVPEINAADAANHHGIIANPNCSTIITAVAVGGVARLSPMESMTVCTYQAVSGAGQAGLRELEDQLLAVSQGGQVAPGVFPAQIAMNVIPFIGALTDNGYTDEEMKMQNEGRRIFHLPSLRVNCTCVRVPVARSHSIAVTVRTEGKIPAAEAEAAIRGFPGCVLASDRLERGYPTPLDTSGQDLVWVGRVREDLTGGNSLCLWCCGDQLRKGAAGNAVQILETLL